MLSREEFENVLETLRRLPFAGSLVLIGSSALYVLSNRIPPLTEDVDLALPESILIERPGEVRHGLETQGFQNVAGTATWVDANGRSLDLVAFAPSVTTDRAGGTPQEPAMVFADLGRILTDPQRRGTVSGSPGHLSAAGLVLSKLITMRLEKGTKDRLHALLLLAEVSRDDAFRHAFTGLARRFPQTLLEDVLPEAQVALLSLREPGASDDHWTSEYARRVDEVRDGFARLEELVGKWF